jgi:hypothetical protein
MTGIFGTFGLIFTAIIALIAIVALVIVIKGIVALSRSSRLASVGLETTGTIVDNQMESHRNHNSNGFSSSYLTFRPVVKYRTQMGQEVVAVGPASSRRSFVKETTVPIRYNPQSPDQIQLLSGHGRGSGGWSMLIGGIVMLIFITGFAVVAYSMQHQAADDCASFANDVPGISTSC